VTVPWEPPVYVDINVRPGYVDYACSRCGVVVTDVIAHNRHHKSLDDLTDAIVAISHVLVPGLPEGYMLQPEPAVKINFVPDGEAEDGKGYVIGESVNLHVRRGGGGGQGASEVDGASGGSGASMFGGNLRVGPGGAGKNSDIPMCPICQAYGGGGHGGGCPNDGKPTYQWIGSDGEPWGFPKEGS
jgi:hypothetical protein